MSEIAVIDFPDQPTAEVVEPLTEGKAKQLDQRIRKAGARVNSEVDGLLKLLRDAHDGQIHVALGFPSWVAYFKDAVGELTWKGREQREALGKALTGSGISNRTAAAMLGVSEITVRRDTEGVDKPEVVETETGQKQPRKKKEKEQEPLDVDEVDPPEDEEPKRTANDVIEDFSAEVDTLLINVQAFKDILKVDAELLPKARKRLAQRFLNRLQGSITDLQSVVDALME